MRQFAFLFLLAFMSVGCQRAQMTLPGMITEEVDENKIEREKTEGSEFEGFKQYPRWKYNPKRRIRPRIKIV